VSKLLSPPNPYRPSDRPSGAHSAPPAPSAVGSVAVRFTGIKVATVGCVPVVFVWSEVIGWCAEGA
jgi:hypothetical protein